MRIASLFTDVGNIGLSIKAALWSEPYRADVQFSFRNSLQRPESTCCVHPALTTAYHGADAPPAIRTGAIVRSGFEGTMTLFFQSAGVILVVILLVLPFLRRWAQAQAEYRKQIDRKYPSLTDEEFVATCAPDVDPRIALQVREVLADGYGVDASQIRADMDLTQIEELAGCL